MPRFKRLRPRKFPVRAAVPLLALVALVGLTACEPVAPFTPRQGAPKAAVLGDSLVWGVQGQLSGALHARGWSPSVTGSPGFPVADHVPNARAVLGSSPRALVVALGTNDVRRMAEGSQSWEGFRRDVRAMVAAARNVDCLVWVGVSDFNGFYGPNIGDLSQVGWAVNYTIASELEASGRPRQSTLFADWAARSRRLDFYVAPGDVHLSSAGATEYARLIESTLDRCPGAPVRGSVDVVRAGPGGVSVTGWVADGDSPTSPVEVHVYVGGRFARSATAQAPRFDVARAFPALGANHGFSLNLQVPPGPTQVCVYAIESHGPPSPNPLLRCANVTVPVPPPTTTSPTTTSPTSPATPTTSVATTPTTQAASPRQSAAQPQASLPESLPEPLPTSPVPSPAELAPLVP